MGSHVNTIQYYEQPEGATIMYHFNFQNPVQIIFGRGRFCELGKIASEYGKKAMIVTYKGAPFQEFSERTTNYLAKCGLDTLLFDEVTQNPLASTVRRGADLAAESGCDLIIGLGGGSAMDTAKGIAFLAGKEGDIFDYIFKQRFGNSALPILLITTTAGTGSEGNCTAVFTNEKTKDKKGLVDPLIFPKVSLIDPEFMTTLPKHIIAGPGVDALFHAFESYISKKSNPVSEMYSLKAMELIIPNLPDVYDNPENIDAWDKVVLANTLAGIAIGAAACTLPHALGQPVSGLLGSVHSDTLAAVYIEFMNYTAPYCEEKFARLAQLLGCDMQSKNRHEAAMESSEYMQAFLERVQMHKTLGSLGVQESDLDWLADNATNQMGAVLANNPVVPNRDEVKEFYRRCL
ncbi:MAG: iron-containing alcohol dehydrogenase [Ruminococcaceae bacterium]|nr:iron-containing alcohol dehydrogenase [Oscillospiraceae bacterium]